MGSPTLLPSGAPSVIFDPRDRGKMECAVFKRIQIVTYPLGGTLIAWELQPDFRKPGPFHFFVDVGRAGTTEWVTLNSNPVVDGCLFIDFKQRHYDHLADFYYRIRLLLPNDSCAVHLSQPQQANGFLSKRDWLLARDIVRREYLYQKKRTNVTNKGYLLKRRRWGQTCKSCVDQDTGEISGQCADCFGTGFTGGYFPAIDFTVTSPADWSREFKLDETAGMTNPVVRMGRAVAYPWLDTNDVFIRRTSGERYFVNKITTLAEVGGVPIVVSPEIRLAPVTDVIYTIPVSGGSSSSSLSSSSSGGVCGPGTGRNNTPAW